MTCGIYAIVNKLNGKRYVGKSVNIEHRWASLLAFLRNTVRSKDCNRHLYNAFQLYKEYNFGFEFLEVFEYRDEDLLKERELYWMLLLRTTERDFGYNLRMDTATKCIVSDETRELLSLANSGENNPNYGNFWTQEQKDRAAQIARDLRARGVYDKESTKQKWSEWATNMWKDSEKKAQMARKVSEARAVYQVAQFNKDGTLVKIYKNIGEVMRENPTFYKMAIYGCMAGQKKSYKGFVWKKFKDISEIEHLIIGKGE